MSRLIDIHGKQADRQGVEVRQGNVKVACDVQQTDTEEGSRLTRVIDVEPSMVLKCVGCAGRVKLRPQARCLAGQKQTTRWSHERAAGNMSN